MGMYDTFIDGDKEVQLKNFHNLFDKYKPGDPVPTEKFGYPEDAIFFPVYDPNVWVLIKDSKFERIFRADVELVYECRIWDSHGHELILQE